MEMSTRLIVCSKTDRGLRRRNNEDTCAVNVACHFCMVADGMGCTAETLTFCRDRFVLGHVGDSRTYLFRDGILTQLTKDHSLVQSHIDQGLLSRQEARKSRFLNILLRVVGNSEKMAVDLSCGDLRPGDTFLLCSDGLHGMVEDNALQPVLAYDAPLDLKAEMLVNMANDAGGRDNVTVVLAFVPA